MPRPISKIPKVIEVSGWFYVTWYDEKTRRTHRLSLRTQDADVATKLFAEFLSGGKAVYENREAGISVEQALDDYYREHALKKFDDTIRRIKEDEALGKPVNLKLIRLQATRNRTRQETAVANLKAHFGAAMFRTIDIPGCRAYAEARRTGKIGGGKRRKEKSVTDSTIRRELVVLGAAARHAIKWKRMTLAEMPSIELTSGNNKKKAEWYTPDELKQLFDRAKDDLSLNTKIGDMRKFLRLLYWIGARCKAIEFLTPIQIDRQGGNIDLLPPGKIQTNKRMPIVPFYDEIKPDIEALVERAGGWNSARPLFGRDMYVAYRAHCEACGLGRKANRHVMRHTRATHMLQDGVSIYDVAKLLGDTVKTIEDNYGHHSAEFLKHKTNGSAPVETLRVTRQNVGQNDSVSSDTNSLKP